MGTILEENLLNFEFKEEELVSNRNINDENQILSIDAKDGAKGLYIKKNNKTLYVHSKYYPIKEAKRWIENVKENIYNYVVFGLGLGYHIEESLHKMHDEGNILIIIPEKEFLYDLLKIKTYKKLFEGKYNIHIHILKDKLHLKDFLFKHIFWKRMDSIEFLYIPAYEKIYEKELYMTVEALRECVLINGVNKNTSRTFAEKWHNNMFNNMPFVFDSIPISAFKDKFTKLPAIVVSAGPSLNKNVNLLKKIKNKALILCVDTALKVLQNEDIKPDLVFSIDGGDLTYEKFRGVKYEEIPLVYTPTSNSKIVSQHKDKKIIFSKEKHIDYLFEKKGYSTFLPVGGTVATVAFQFARYINADPIIFIGQDLAFTSGKNHAEGTMYDKMGNLFKNRKMILIRGNIEEKVYTDYVFKSYLDWFKDAIMSDETGREFINATEGGAYIEGTKIMTLQEVINKYCIKNNNIESKLKEILLSEKVFSDEDIIDTYKMHKSSVKSLEQIQFKAKEAISLVKEVINMYGKNNYSKNKVSKNIKKLDDIDKFIKEKEKDTEFISYIIQKSINKMEYELYINENPKETEKEKAIRIMNGNLVLYEGIYKSIKETLKIMGNYFNEMSRKYNID